MDVVSLRSSPLRALEPSEGLSQEIDNQIHNGEAVGQSSPVASLSAGKGCTELGEIVDVWANLPDVKKAAILAIVRSSGREVDG
jgi:hypothetical protein